MPQLQLPVAFSEFLRVFFRSLWRCFEMRLRLSWHANILAALSSISSVCLLNKQTKKKHAKMCNYYINSPLMQDWSEMCQEFSRGPRELRVHRQRLSPLLQLLHGGGDLIGLLLQTADHVVLLLHLIIRCLAHRDYVVLLAALFALCEGRRNPFCAPQARHTGSKANVVHL